MTHPADLGDRLVRILPGANLGSHNCHLLGSDVHLSLVDTHRALVVDATKTEKQEPTESSHQPSSRPHCPCEVLGHSKLKHSYHSADELEH
jgi:hypothetical protein